MKTVFIESAGLVYHWLGDRYELPTGRHEITGVMPKKGGGEDESDFTKAHRVAQMLKKSYPDQITLSVEYDEHSKTPAQVEAATPTQFGEAKETVEEVPPAVTEEPEPTPEPRKKYEPPQERRTFPHRNADLKKKK